MSEQSKQQGKPRVLSFVAINAVHIGTRVSESFQHGFGSWPCEGPDKKPRQVGGLDLEWFQHGVMVRSFTRGPKDEALPAKMTFVPWANIKHADMAE